MSLIFMDGFDNYNYLPLKWETYTHHNTTFTPHYITDSTSRHGSHCLCIRSQTVANKVLGKTFTEDYQELVLGFAYKPMYDDGGSVELKFLNEGAVQSIFRLHSTSFSWSSYAGTYHGVTHSLRYQEWNFVEIKLGMHTVSGTVTVRVDEIERLHKTNLDTSTGNEYIDEFYFYVNHSTGHNADYAFIDDLYILTTSGTYNNDFLGDCVVSTSYPMSDIQDQFMLPPSISGVDNYTMVTDSHEYDETIYSATFYEYSIVDDGYTYSTNFYNTGTYINVSTYNDSKSYFRFHHVDIPKNAKIVSAKVNLHNLQSDLGLYAYVYFQDQGTPVDPITDMTDLVSRPRTTYAGNYNDVLNPLQEIVGRTDWQEVDNTVLVIQRGGSYVGGYNVDSYRAYNNPSHVNSPNLYVQWQLPSGDSGNYVYTDQKNITDTYKINTASGITSQIFGINHSIASKRDYTINNYNYLQLASVISISGTTYSGTPYLPDEHKYIHGNNIMEINPLTDLPWTINDLSVAAFGFTTISGN